MISMGVPTGDGGGSKSGKLFVTRDDGDPGDDGHICINFIFEILPPSPSPYSQAQDPDGEFRWGVGDGGGGGNHFNFRRERPVPGVTCRSSRS